MTLSFSTANREPQAPGAGVTAVLGPTNTGKTHLAIERMLAHSSGVIGLPLRLLAREVYGKIVDRIGPNEVALVTGEEKIKPAHPRFWVATVEAMPRDLDVSFVAIDEVQLGADLDRGHVFTDRILNRRGRDETLLLGAQTMRPIIEKLLPRAHILSRPRLSQLTFAGDAKITRLPRRSAIVAFSADEVYAIAELIRRQRGGAAVVLGALSPRTRNAQVELFQSGEVDYLVATDAIGMGLNLDVNHVAFASERKFDGYQFRRLNPSEFAQIAGRAGRAMRDGTFGTTGRCDPFEPELVQALESHSFESVKVLQWRNSDLDFATIGALQASLAVTPEQSGLTRAPIAEDIRVLEHAVRDDEVRALANSRPAVQRLWEACQIPDYRRISPSAHAEMVISLFGFLMRQGRVPTDWFARQVSFADRTDGDIDTLSNRIAHIRTWTFAANRPDWLDDPEHWQNVTRGIEDKLSDALHEQLLHRFVDRRTSVLMRRLRENAMLETEVTKTGEVLVEGHPVGRLEGFRFAAEAAGAGPEAKALRGAAQRGLASEIAARSTKLAAAPDNQFVLASDGSIRWIGDLVGKLAAGDDVLKPHVRILADEQLTGAARDSVQGRLDLWVTAHVEKLLGPLLALSRAEDITGIGRGIAFQLTEAMGVLERQKVGEEMKTLDQSARATLRNYGIRFGAYHIYLPALLKPAPRALALQLWVLKHGSAETHGLDELPHLAASGRTSIPVDVAIPKSLYRTIGYRVCGGRAVRVDILERLADLIRPALAWRPNSPSPKPAGAVDGSGFSVTGAMTSLVGSSGEDFASILTSLGYRMQKRPKPAEPAPAPAPAPDVVSPSAEAAAETDSSASAVESPTVEASAEPTGEPSPETAPAALADESVAEPAEIVEEVAAQAAEARSVEAAETSAAETGGETSAEVLPTSSPETAASPDAAAASEAAADAAPTPAEPEMIEVWRPGRMDRGTDQRRGRSQGPRQGHRQGAGRDQQRPAAASGEAAAASTEQAAPRPEGSADGPKDRGKERFRRNRPFRGAEQDGKPRSDGARPHGPRPDRPRPERSREDRGGRDDRNREDRRPPHRADKDRSSPRPERREKQPDPNSPFAKLLALKEQLEAAKNRG